MKLSRLANSAFFAGLVLGVGAAMVQAYFRLLPPMAYGVCMVCHPKELVNWVADHLLNTHWGYSIASLQAPILTVVGVVAGSLISSVRHGEFHLRPARQPVLYFVFGFLMINSGLILGSCPIRIVLLTAYGSVMGLIGWALVMAGVAIGLFALRWWTARTV